MQCNNDDLYCVRDSGLSRLICSFVVSPEKATYRGFFGVCGSVPFACPEHNFLTLSSNDTKLGVHVSCNELKCRVQES